MNNSIKALLVIASTILIIFISVTVTQNASQKNMVRNADLQEAIKATDNRTGIEIAQDQAAADYYTYCIRQANPANPELCAKKWINVKATAADRERRAEQRGMRIEEYLKAKANK